MSKLSKIIAILLLLTACVQVPVEEPEIIDPIIEFAKPKGTILTPDQIESVQNTITVAINETRTEADLEHTGYCTYPEISGMADLSLQDKINLSLKASVFYYCENLGRDKIPAFQGLYAYFGRLPSIKQRFVTSTVVYNENNILSIMVLVWFVIGSGKQSAETYSLIGLNIDLTTGNTVNLADLFINGYDYEDLINNAIMKDTAYHWYEPGEVPDGSPDGIWSGWGNTRYVMNYGFEGITPTQKFFITSSGIEMIFDETTPAFNCLVVYPNHPIFHSFAIFVPFPSDGTAIKQRFTK